ncbi:MAG: CBS domain-containing protein, partial [Halobacteriaceae archaeon]
CNSPTRLNSSGHQVILRTRRYPSWENIMVTASDIAATDVVSAARNDSVSNVAEMMGEEQVGSVVVEEENVPVGIVTDRQIALGVAKDPELGHETVDTVMTKDVKTIHEDSTIFQAAQVLSEEGVRRAPVVDDDGWLVGLLALDDLLFVIQEEFDTAEDVIEAQSPRF